VRIGIVILTFCIFGSTGAAKAPPDELASVEGVVSVVRKTKGSADDWGVAIWLKPVA